MRYFGILAPWSPDVAAGLCCAFVRVCACAHDAAALELRRAAAGSGCAFKCVVKLSACRHQARRTAGFQRRSLSRGSLKRWDGHSKVPYAHVHHASPLRPFNELSCSETGDGCQSVVIVRTFTTLYILHVLGQLELILRVSIFSCTLVKIVASPPVIYGRQAMPICSSTVVTVPCVSRMSGAQTKPCTIVFIEAVPLVTKTPNQST